MRQVAERNAALLDINNAIITQLTQNELFRTICQALRRITPYDRAALTLFDGEARRLRFVALEGEFFSNFFRVGQTLGIDDSHFGWAFARQRPLLRRDMETERKVLSEGICSTRCRVVLSAFASADSWQTGAAVLYCLSASNC